MVWASTRPVVATRQRQRQRQRQRRGGEAPQRQVWVMVHSGPLVQVHEVQLASGEQLRTQLAEAEELGLLVLQPMPVV